MVVVKRLAPMLVLVLVAAACGGDDTGSGGDGAADATTTTAAIAATTTTSTTIPDPGGDGIVAEEGDHVEVHYIGTLDDGTEFDASRPRGAPLDFVIGSGAMIAGFDAGVRGMALGEMKTIRIEPADAYGEVDPELIVEVDISQVPEGTVAGEVLTDQTGSRVNVVSIVEGTVTLDFNPQLAGEALTFEIEMVTITR